MNRSFAALTRALVLGAMAGAVPAVAAAQAGDPVRIASTLPLSGNAANFGQFARNGAELAVEEINAAGGVLGRPVQLEVEDNRCNPAEAVRIATQMLSDEGYAAMFDGLCSSVILAIMPIVARAEVPLMVATASATAISEQAGVGGNEWTFKFNPSDLTMATAMVSWLDEAGLADEVAFLGEETDFGRSGSEGFRVALEGIGKELASEDYYQQGTADFSAVLTKLKASDPSVVALYGLSGDQQNIINQMAAFDVRIPLTGRLQTDVMPPEVLASGFLDGTTSVQPYSSELDTEENRDFVARYEAKHGGPPNSIAYSSYEAMRTLIDAIDRAGSTDHTAIRDAIRTSQFPSMLGGTVEFDANHLAHNFAVILIIEAGVARIVGVSKT